jgi:hypothetical protein
MPRKHRHPPPRKRRRTRRSKSNHDEDQTTIYSFWNKPWGPKYTILGSWYMTCGISCLLSYPVWTH